MEQTLRCAVCGAGAAPHAMRAVLAEDTAGRVDAIAACQDGKACRERQRQRESRLVIGQSNQAA